MDEGSDLFPLAVLAPDEHALAMQIVAEHEAVRAAAANALEHAIKCGQFLLKAQEKYGGHGQWLPWLQTNCELSIRTAQDYMRLARSDLSRLMPDDAQRAAHLSIRSALKRLASPKALAKALDDAEPPEAESVAESSARRVGQGLPASVLKTMRNAPRKRIGPIRDDVVGWLGDHRLGGDAARAWFRQASTVQRMRHLDELLETLSEGEMDEFLTNPRLRIEEGWRREDA
jgi:Protein of unknown function (DUF3102)